MLKSSQGRIEVRNYPKQISTTVAESGRTAFSNSPRVTKPFDRKLLMEDRNGDGDADADEELVEIHEPTSEEENGQERGQEGDYLQLDSSRNGGQGIPEESRLQTKALRDEKGMKRRHEGNGMARRHKSRRSRAKKKRKQCAVRSVGGVFHSS